jgi:hypothetical protein
MPRIGSDLSEAVGPVVAASSEYFDRGVSQVDLNPVAVKLDLVEPPLPSRYLLYRCRERRFNEAGGKWLSFRSRPVFCAGTPCSHKADRQRQLNVVISAFVTIDEIL